MSPSLFVDVDNQMSIAREEIFGPVLVVIPYEDEEDAIHIANDSPYGLAGYVLADSLDRSVAVARRLRAGTIGLNGGVSYGARTRPSGDSRTAVSVARTVLAGFLEQYPQVKSVAWPAG